MTGPERTPESGTTGDQQVDAPSVRTAAARSGPFARIPSHVGRARTSTVVLTTLFVLIYALYLSIKPGEAGGVAPAGTTTEQPAAPAPTTSAPGTTSAPETSTAPTSSVPTSTRVPTPTSEPATSTSSPATTSPAETSAPVEPTDATSSSPAGTPTTSPTG